MELTISWTKEDIERKLREELETSGFRLIEAPEEEEESAEEGKKRKRSPQTFQWSYRPNLTVQCRAEPDPDAVLEPEAAIVGPMTVSEPNEEPAAVPEEEDADVEIPEGTGFLPPGTATAINEAVKAQKQGKNIGRRRMAGESDERPD